MICEVLICTEVNRELFVGKDPVTVKGKPIEKNFCTVVTAHIPAYSERKTLVLEGMTRSILIRLEGSLAWVGLTRSCLLKTSRR